MDDIITAGYLDSFNYVDDNQAFVIYFLHMGRKHSRLNNP